MNIIYANVCILIISATGREQDCKHGGEQGLPERNHPTGMVCSMFNYCFISEPQFHHFIGNNTEKKSTHVLR